MNKLLARFIGQNIVTCQWRVDRLICEILTNHDIFASESFGKCTWFHLRMSKILFAAKQSWTTLPMSRSPFVGSYLQVTWWALGQWKGRKVCFEWLSNILDYSTIWTDPEVNSCPSKYTRSHLNQNQKKMRLSYIFYNLTVCFNMASHSF